MKKCCILVYCDKPDYYDDGTPIHWYGGYFASTYHDNQYVKDFYDNEVTLTYDLLESHLFTSDEECNACMEKLVKMGAWTICQWDYENNSRLMKMFSLKERWERESDTYRGYGYPVNPPFDFYEGMRDALKHPSSQHVNYPNEHWSINGCLQPSLMHESVGEWRERNKKE